MNRICNFALLLLLGLLGLTAGCRTAMATAPDKPHASGREQAWKALLEFEGRELAKLDDTESGKLYRAIGILGIKPEKHLRTCPRLFTTLKNAEGRKQHILVKTRGLFTPGDSAARLFVFSERGEILNDQPFSTGWRIAIKSVSKFVEDSTGTEMILIESDPSWGGGDDIYKQFYALMGNSVVLVRLEGPEGGLARNDYDTPHFTIGPVMPWNTSSGLVDKVSKGKWAEKLAALIWLGGKHEDPGDEMKKDAELAKELLGNEKLLKHITCLSEAKDEWLSQAANLVLESLKEDE